MSQKEQEVKDSQNKGIGKNDDQKIESKIESKIDLNSDQKNKRINRNTAKTSSRI